MAIENKGPGGIGNAYGSRGTVPSSSIGTGIPKDIYTGFNTDPVTPGGGGGTTKFSATAALANATPVVLALGGANANSVYMVSVNPATGDTIRVESGTSATGPWTAWTNGDVSTTSFAYLFPSTPANTHVRFTRVSGSGTTSRYYINEQ